MKKILITILGCALAFGVALIVVSREIVARRDAEIAVLQQEKAALGKALEDARAIPPRDTSPIEFSGKPKPFLAPTVIPNSHQFSPEILIARLRNAKFTPGAGQTRVMRQIIHDLDELVAAGHEALPAIREFLSQNEEVEFNASPYSRGPRAVPQEFLIPPSLRFGLFDVVKQIGGPDAEKLLADTLNSNHRGVEIAWLANALQDMAPGKYRDAALAAARGVIEQSIEPKSADREQAFKVLSTFNDASYVATAQAQLIRADGQVDGAALNYLVQALGPQAVSLAAQLYDDPRITDPQKKEPFARVALNYVGADTTANSFYVKAINDFGLSKDQRKNLIEDLNEGGFVDRKNLTSNRDLPLINNRMALIEQLVPDTTDPVNLAAMKEAYKDLVKMREKITMRPAQ